MHVPALFDSFFLGGFECSTHRRSDGRRLDLIEATAHARWAKEDYAALRHHGLRSVRDSLRWHLIEHRAGHYDWSGFLPQLRAATASNTQVIWDLCHYGWPDDVDVWQPQFVGRFARFAAAVAHLVYNESDQVPYYSPVNEISFCSWAGGEVAYFAPMGQGRGAEFKHQLVRASIAAIEAIRAVDPRARFVQADPLIHVLARGNSPAAEADAERYRVAQFEAWDMLAGKQWPGLGGQPQYLDILGANFYPSNQWYMGGGTLARGEARYRPFSGMLAELHQRYQRPVLVAETGAEGDQRQDWLRYVCEQVRLALQRGVPLEGICLYPVLDYPGWTDDRYCPAGLFGYADEQGERPLCRSLADELRLQQALCAAPTDQSATRE